MKISTKGRYGLRAMVELAAQYKGGPVALASIAKSQKISSNYLEQVFTRLRKAEIVKSQKGSQGGYILAKDPKDIPVEAVLTALEGKFSISHEEVTGESPDLVQATIQELVWDKINHNVNEFLTGITLADLVKDYEKRCQSQYMMYYI